MEFLLSYLLLAGSPAAAVAASATGMSINNIFMWITCALGGTIVAMAKYCVSLHKEKTKEIEDLNLKHNTAIEKLHTSYQDKMGEVRKEKEIEVNKITSSKDKNSEEFFERVTNLLREQINMALTNQQYSDKMMEVMQEYVSKMDTNISEFSDIKAAIIKILEILKHEKR